MRPDQRVPNQIRPVTIEPEYLRYAEGSALISMGHTKVICTASLEPMVPKWLAGTGTGWVTAEYNMLPRSTHTRIRRDKALNSGRSQEISRLIGRSLRAAVDLKALGEKQIAVDCDVIQADGGTRTASITGGFVALAFALQFLKSQGQLQTLPLKQYVAAISVGLGNEGALLDLNYDEDSSCDTDMNFVGTSDGNFVEIQGTAEGRSFTRDQMTEMTDLALSGIQELFSKQAEVIGSFFPLKGQS
ncbi:MAG TPA: ribonuclease PH [Bdellovibrionales bacterium]|nr:ribonuclease PH [Pseudobdellovibrionaceae bacterium]HAG91655.1 ribonuclease PH [Bdellovibrionales bacterium]|tara:strand:+ start:5887 stop:6621 length:735 start_codon:yes stop_codon:yes gene_type:complete